MTDTLKVHGNHGILEINKDTGDVIAMWPEGDDVESQRLYRGIQKFDLGEWRRYYGFGTQHWAEIEDIDILDLGYWYNTIEGRDPTIQYEPPAHDWRKLSISNRPKKRRGTGNA